MPKQMKPLQPIERQVGEVGSFTRAEREAVDWEERLTAYCAEVGYTTDRRDMFWRMESDGRLLLYRRVTDVDEGLKEAQRDMESGRFQVFDSMDDFIQSLDEPVAEE